MSRIFTATLFTLVLASSVHSAGKPLPPRVEQIMGQTKYQHANWGILVKDTVTQQVVYEKNANQFFLPGSTTKIFSVAALLRAYGDNYRFKTPIYADGPLKGGVLKGNLIVVGQGDLTFGGRQEVGSDEIAYTKMDHIYANMLPDAFLTPQDPLNAVNALAKEVKEKGIVRVDGDLLIDDRLFETLVLRESVISPLMINENLIDVIIHPTTVGQKAEVSWRPNVAGYTLVNECTTVAKEQPFEVDVDFNQTAKTLRVSGNIPEDQKELIRTASIQDPKAFAKDAFVQALGAQGVVVSGKKVGQLPAKGGYAAMQPVAVWTSPPLSEYAKLILKVSHNPGANLCPLLLAAQKGEETFNAGMLLLGKFVTEEVKLPLDSFVFTDGAGGDGNRFTPQAEVQLLEYVRSWPKESFQKYYNGFPILGVNGSIEDFGKGTAAAGKVYAKTGTGIAINLATNQFFLNTQALAGYIEGKNGHLLEFMIAVNNANMPKLDEIIAIFDDECQMTVEFYNMSQ
jgi:D-alanyl-D-alanine carboxypeptidase/D-alanyl-D-alanine-endopeptidase (penicillin-binding protein 4)